jgi:hypothetical protein
MPNDSDGRGSGKDPPPPPPPDSDTNYFVRRKDGSVDRSYDRGKGRKDGYYKKTPTGGRDKKK